MTQGTNGENSFSSALPWALSVLVVIAGATLFWIAGGIWFDRAEIDEPAGPWSLLTGMGVLLAAAGFLAALLLMSNALIRRQRASILPTVRLR